MEINETMLTKGSYIDLIVNLLLHKTDHNEPVQRLVKVMDNKMEEVDA